MRVGGLAVVMGMLLLVACGAERNKNRPYFHDDSAGKPEFSAAQLGDPFDDDSVTDFLEPEERAAVQRAGMSGFDLDTPRPPLAPVAPRTGFGHVCDVIGNIGVSILGVAVTIGMAIAPFFLF